MTKNITKNINNDYDINNDCDINDDFIIKFIDRDFCDELIHFLNYDYDSIINKNTNNTLMKNIFNNDKVNKTIKKLKKENIIKNDPIIKDFDIRMYPSVVYLDTIKLFNGLLICEKISESLD